MKKIILATTSPYRQEAFQLAGVEFEAVGSNVEEKFEGRPNNPNELVCELAKQKALAVAEKFKEGVVVGFDSVGWFNGEILEKPQSEEEAVLRMQALSGNSFEFFTGIYLIDVVEKKITQASVVTKVNMRNITDDEIKKYLKQDDKFKTYAVGFDPLGHYSSTFAIDIVGSYNNFLRGIPTEHIIEMLKEAGVEIR
jgi:septum formation protein